MNNAHTTDRGRTELATNQKLKTTNFCQLETSDIFNHSICLHSLSYKRFRSYRKPTPCQGGTNNNSDPPHRRSTQALITRTTANNTHIMKSSKKNPKKPKLTKEERRAKYTAIARKRRQGKRDRKAGSTSQKDSVCYHCRKSGHTIATCPQQNVNEEMLCYKCGSTEHGLHKCPLRNDQHRPGEREELPFATCFVCKEKGHLASGCPHNQNGIYVNKGECRYCGSVEHLASGCPQKQKKKSRKEKEVAVEDLLEQPVENQKIVKVAPTTRRVVNF